MINIFRKMEKNSIRKSFLKAYVLFLIIPMLILYAVIIWQTYIIEYDDVLNIQREKLAKIEISINNYINNLENELKYVVETNNILKQAPGQQYKIISGLLSFNDKSYKDKFNELVLLDVEGKEKVRVSRVNVYLDKELGERSKSEEFIMSGKKGETCFSRIFFNNETGEPSINMALPLFDIQNGLIGGVLIAEIRLRDIWHFIEKAYSGSKDNIYVLDNNGKVVAHNMNVSVVLKGTLFHPVEKHGIQKGLFGSNVFMSSKKVPIGNQIVYIVTERSVFDAFSLVFRIILLYILSFIVFVMILVVIERFISQRIIKPIESLAHTAKAISEGELSVRADEKNTGEFGILAAAFNRMASRLIETINFLRKIIEERDIAHEELKNAHERFLTVLNGLNAVVYVADMETNEVLFINKYAENIFGDAYGKKCWQIFQNKQSGPCEFCNNKKLLSGESEAGESFIREFQNPVNNKWYYAYDKAIYWVNKRIVRLTIATDITERKNLEETIKYQALHDVLTGLPNRMLFLDRLTLEMAHSQRGKTKLAVLFLDLDRFKNINDTLGHTIGDNLLKAVAVRIKACIRASDTVSRIGGDEFNILLEEVSYIDNIAVSAQKILSAFNEPFAIDGNELYISASIGISVFPDDGSHIEDLLRNADIAMYKAKEKGRNNFQFYDPSMNLRIVEKIILQNSLRQAVEQGELVLYYQPQVDILTKKIVGVEALVRWNHPELGILLPKDFLYVAEETGFIKFIDTWVLNEACRQNKAWQESGFSPFCMTVNLSVPQFQRSDLVDIVSKVLNGTGLDPEYLNLEITENIVLRDIEMTMPNITRLNNMGVRFFIDDFGVGYSSLSWFKKFHIQKLKVDKSFIDDITVNADSRAIITAIIAMAHNLKIKVIAEGVENNDQLEYLRTIGCNEIQGYLVSKPVPQKEFEKLIAGG